MNTQNNQRAQHTQKKIREVLLKKLSVNESIRSRFRKFVEMQTSTERLFMRTMTIFTI